VPDQIPKELMQIIDLYKQTFNTDEGKKVLEDLRLRCFSKKSTFDKDANVTAFNEGQRQVVMHIEGFINYKSVKE
tara:strand:- start:993 stop:1217 length:225 start_codon:yes stop_codon:yes gene_type:complete